MSGHTVRATPDLLGIPLEIGITIYEHLYKERLYQWDCAKTRKIRHGRDPVAVKTDRELLSAMLLVNKQICAKHQKYWLRFGHLSANFESILTFQYGDKPLPRSIDHLELLKHATIYVDLKPLHRDIGWRDIGWRDIEMLAKGIKRRASYSKSIRIVLRHPFLSVSERAITTWQFASGGNQYDVDMQHLLEHPLYTLEGFLLIQGGKGHSIETSRGITESNGYGLGRELHYVHSIAAFLYAHDANVDKDWTRNRVLQHWPPGIEDQYSDDVFERSELPPEVIDRMCRRIDKMLEWFVTRGSKVDERSNIAGKPAEIVGREDEGCSLGEGWETFGRNQVH